VFVHKVLNSAADVQEHETLMNQNDKPPNERYLKVYTVVRFLILAGMVLVVVFLLIVIFCCITNVHYTPAFPTQVNEYKKLKNSISENELVQNV
jgi:magnesium-transporting ATPase (P-type)